MAPLIALLAGTLLARLVGTQGLAPVSSWPAAVAVGLAAMFTLTGIAHFVPKMRAAMIAIVPPRIPAPGFLVALTGVLELLGAIGVLIPLDEGGGSRVLGSAAGGDVSGQCVCRQSAVESAVHSPWLAHRRTAAVSRGDRARRMGLDEVPDQDCGQHSHPIERPMQRDRR